MPGRSTSATQRVRRLLAPAAVTACALALGGCGLGVRLPAVGPSDAGTRTNASSTSITASNQGPARAPAPASRSTVSPPTVRANEVTTPPGPEERAPASGSAAAALRRFGSVYINWNAADVRRQLTALAADSVGQARTAMQLEAAQTGADAELRQAGIANRGSVEAVAPLAGSGHRWVVITRETTTATDSSAYAGLTAAWHLTVATVARRGAGWVISGWQPES